MRCIGDVVEVVGLVSAKQHNHKLAKVLSTGSGADGDRWGVRIVFGEAAGKELSIKPQNVRPLSDTLRSLTEKETWDGSACTREVSIAYTIALAATMLKEEVNASMTRRDDSVLILHLLGCRWHVEGQIDSELLIDLLDRSLRFKELRLVFNGPELLWANCGGPPPDPSNPEADLPPEAHEALKKAVQSGSGRLEVGVQPHLWLAKEPLPAAGNHRLSITDGDKEDRPDLAIILNGGFDENFGSWACSLWKLLALGVPTAVTGYGASDGSTSEVDSGYESLLRRLGARFVAPQCVNPFRVSHPFMPDMASEAFMIAINGADHLITGTSEALRMVQHEQRLERLDDLVRLNRLKGRNSAAEKLVQLRADLAAGTVMMNPSVTYGDMEQWAYGRRAAKW